MKNRNFKYLFKEKKKRKNPRTQKNTKIYRTHVNKSLMTVEILAYVDILDINTDMPELKLKTVAIS